MWVHHVGKCIMWVHLVGAPRGWVKVGRFQKQMPQICQICQICEVLFPRPPAAPTTRKPLSLFVFSADSVPLYGGGAAVQGLINMVQDVLPANKKGILLWIQECKVTLKNTPVFSLVGNSPECAI